MLIPSQVIAILKYGFLGLVVTGAGFLIANVVVLKYQQSEDIDDLVYYPQVFFSTASSSSMLDKDFLACLTHPSKTFCVVSAGRRLQRLRRRLAANQSSKDLSKSLRRRALSRTLSDFCSLVQPFDLKPILIEPSMLFCILSPFSKYHLITNGYRPGAFVGSKRVLTVAAAAEGLQILGEESFQEKALAAGFEMERIQNSDSATSHLLFKRRNSTIHVVGLFGDNEQYSYLWTRAWESNDVGPETLLFTGANSFENFTYTPLQKIYPDETMSLYLPSFPSSFLLDTTISKFESCSPNSNLSIAKHPHLTLDQMKLRTVVVFREMRNLLKPIFEPIWLWAESFAGWLEKCDIFQNTFELTVAVHSTSMQNLNETFFKDSNYLKVVEEHSYDSQKCKLILDCHGLRVNIFSAFYDDTSVWYYDIDENNSTSRIVLPKFTLCSADVFGQRVHVPCSPGTFIIPNNKNISVHF